MREAAEVTGQFFVNQRWLGGTLTNLQTIRRSVARLREFEELEKTPAFSRMNKRRLLLCDREAAKLRRNLEGLLNMERLPDAIVVIDRSAKKLPSPRHLV